MAGRFLAPDPWPLTLMDRAADLNRVRWQCRRGMLELDLALNRFLKDGYSLLPKNLQSAFSALLELPDPDLWDIVRGSAEPQDADMRTVAALLQYIKSAGV